MLLDLGCKYVIVGHSERRHKLGESDTFINEKVKVALAAGLDVILCVGETLEQRRANQTEALLDRQLGLGLANVQSGTLRRVSIAYEPVWAIGNAKHHATPQPRRLMLSFERASDRFLAGTPLMKSRSSTEAALFPAMPPLCSGGRASTAL
jgi:triosephosphate isomerase